MRVSPDVLEGVLSDDSQQYDGDLTEVMPDSFAESGRGPALARTALDEFDYAREDGCNVWTMCRRLPASA